MTSKIAVLCAVATFPNCPHVTRYTVPILSFCNQMVHEHGNCHKDTVDSDDARTISACLAAAVGAAVENASNHCYKGFR